MVVLKYCPTKVMTIEFFMKRLEKLKHITSKVTRLRRWEFIIN